MNYISPPPPRGKKELTKQWKNAVVKARQVEGSAGSLVLLEQRAQGIGQGSRKEGGGFRPDIALGMVLARSASNHLLLVSTTTLLLFTFEGYSNPTWSHELRLPFFPQSSLPHLNQVPYLWIIPCSFPCCSTAKILLSDLFCILGKMQRARQWWAGLLLILTPGGTFQVNGMIFLNTVLICQVKKELSSSEKWSHRDWAFAVSVLRICRWERMEGAIKTG